jgi:hypothetical protein
VAVYAVRPRESGRPSFARQRSRSPAPDHTKSGQQRRCTNPGKKSGPHDASRGGPRPSTTNLPARLTRRRAELPVAQRQPEESHARHEPSLPASGYLAIAGSPMAARSEALVEVLPRRGRRRRSVFPHGSAVSRAKTSRSGRRWPRGPRCSWLGPDRSLGMPLSSTGGPQRPCDR